MKETLKKLKKLIRNFKYLIKLENEINLYFKYPTEVSINKLEKQKISIKCVNKLYSSITLIKETVAKEIENLENFEKDIIIALCINGVGIHIISMDYYVGLTTIYRMINNFTLKLYYITLKNKDFKKSVNYVINHLQNI